MPPSLPLKQRVVDGWMYALHWLYDLPTWLFALLTILIFVMVSLIGLALTHRRLHASAFAVLIDNGTVGWFFSGVSVLYGLLLGLITVATWGNYSQASNVASSEAATIAVLYRDLAGYTPTERQQMRGQLRAYTRAIIDQSWPAQREGVIHNGEAKILGTLQTTLFDADTNTDNQRILHAEAIRAFNSMIELRRQRLESVKGAVPGVLWSVVLLGGFITIAFSYCFVVKSYRLHALMTGMLASMIGLLVFLLAALDHPYWGEVSVSADAYELVYTALMATP